jgi:hypothetical protein
MATQAVFTHGYALLIGVGADLPVTVRDARGLRDILIDPERCAYPPSQVRLLTEAEATRHGILDGLDWLAAQAARDPSAACLVFFSGHGGHLPHYFLVPYGYDGARPAETAVSGAEFSERLRAIQAQKLLTLLDCCHAGGMAEAKAAGFVKSPLPPELETVLTAGSGRAVIASSRKDEVSYTGTPYSAFTQALREALAGYGAAERDGYAYLADVALYVGRVVPQRTQDRQHPILKLAAADNFAIAYYAGGDKAPRGLADALAVPAAVEAADPEPAQGYRSVLRQYQRNLLAVEERMAQFYDQAAVPLDLERTKRGILQKIAEIETHIAAGTQSQTPEVGVTSGVPSDAKNSRVSLPASPPTPAFDVDLLDALTAPGGAVDLHDPFYIVRDADGRLQRELARRGRGTTVTIRAPRQTGKSSLLARGMHFARERGARILYLDLQRVERRALAGPDRFLRYLADLVAHQLRLDAREVEHAWRGPLGPQDRLTVLLEDTVLPAAEAPLVLAVDEADRLLQTGFHSDFFALVRSWHDARARDERWERIHFVIVISTEPYLLIANANQSPFNVGLKLYLHDFDAAQVAELNRRHGTPLGETELTDLLQLTGGQPYLTRTALYAVVVEGHRWTELRRQAAEDRGPFGDHLRHHLQILHDQPSLRDALRHALRHGECPDAAARFRLVQAGLLRESGDACAPRCELYRRYFQDRL